MPIYVIDKLKPAIANPEEGATFKLADASDIEDNSTHGNVNDSLISIRSAQSTAQLRLDSIDKHIETINSDIKGLQNVTIIDGGTSEQFINTQEQ